jgi:hypothetical protein
VGPGGRPPLDAGRPGRPVHQPARRTRPGPGIRPLRTERGSCHHLGPPPAPLPGRRPHGCETAEGERVGQLVRCLDGGTGGGRVVLRLPRPPGLPGRPGPAAGRPGLRPARGHGQLRRRVPAAADQHRLARRARLLAYPRRRAAGPDDQVPAQRGGDRGAALGRGPVAPHPHRRGAVPRGQAVRALRRHHHRPGHRRARPAAARAARPAPPVRPGARVRAEHDPRRRRPDPGRRPRGDPGSSVTG